MPIRNDEGTDNSKANESLVFDNLGVDPNELTGGDTDFGDDLEQQEVVQPNRETDDSNVTHTQQQQRTQLDDLQRDRRRPFPAGSEVKPDAKGNLVDAQGRIVARAGPHARHYQELVRTKATVAEANTRSTDLESRLGQAIGVARDLNDKVQAYEAQTNQMKELGLTPQDQLSAMQMFSELRRDGVGTVKKLLTQLAARGINVANEFGTPTGGVDTKALLDLVREEVGKVTKPISDRTEAEKRLQEQQNRNNQTRDEAQKEVQSFFARNPEATPYMSVFERLLADPRYKERSLGELWANIVMNLDRVQRPSDPNSRQRSLPNGRGQQPIRQQMDVAPVNQSYADIAKGVMRDLGINN